MSNSLDSELNEQLKEMMQQLLGASVAFAEALAGVNAEADTPIGDRFANAVAIYAGKQRDAFVSQGFSREEAVALVGNQLQMLNKQQS